MKDGKPDLVAIRDLAKDAEGILIRLSVAALRDAGASEIEKYVLKLGKALSDIQALCEDTRGDERD